jgi:hypothetical protein
MFSTSRDILNFALSVSVLSLAFFLSWGLFYLAMMGRKIYLLTREAGEVITNIKETTKVIREKVEASAAMIAFISEGIKKIVETVDERKTMKKKHKAQKE